MSSSVGPNSLTQPERGPDAEKADAVLQVLAGGDPLATARDHEVGLDELREWIRAFVQGGREGLRESRDPPDDAERLRAWCTIGELTMRVDLLRRFIARKGYADELEELERRTPSPFPGRLP